MISKFSAHVAALACAAFLVTAPALAKPYTVIPGDQPITIDVPSTWKVEEVKRGIQANTVDEEVYIWFESYRPSQFETLLKEHNAYYEEQGVKITGEPQQTQKDFQTYVLKVSEYPATYEGKPTVLRYLSAVPKTEGIRHLLVTYWASPEADKEYDDEVNGIMNSLRKSYDGQ